MTTRTTASVSQAGTVLAILQLFQTADAGEQRTESLKRILHKYADEVAAAQATAAAAASPVPEPTLPAPDLYAHELITNGGGVWLGVHERSICEQAHEPGETGDEIRSYYTAEQMLTYGNQQFNAGRQFEAERLAALHAEAAAAQQPVARVESWTNGSYWRNYKLKWLQDVPAGTLLFAGAAPAASEPVTAEQHFKLTDHEIEHLRTNPHALDLLMDYHDARQAEADAFFDGADIGTTGNKLRRQALYERGRSLMAEDLDVWPDHLRTAFGFPAYAPADTKANAGWLREGGLLYRLTEGKRPENRDEINVTMADGSRSPEARARRAGELLDLINGTAGAAANKETP